MILRKFSIQVFYTEDGDRKTSVFHCEAKDIPSAYDCARKAFDNFGTVKFGAIMPGHVMMGG